MRDKIGRRATVGICVGALGSLYSRLAYAEEERLKSPQVGDYWKTEERVEVILPVERRAAVLRILLFHNMPSIQPFLDLDRRGYKIVRMEEVIDFFQGRSFYFPSKAALVTFDDAWIVHYDKGLALMERISSELGYYVNFTWAIMPKYVDRGLKTRIFDDGSGRHATLEMVIRARQSGVYLANHTVDHANLTQLREDDRNAQIAVGFMNIAKICELSGVAQRGKVVIYPFGLRNSSVISSLNYMGVDIGMTMNKVSNGSLDIQSFDTRFDMNREWKS